MSQAQKIKISKDPLNGYSFSREKLQGYYDTLINLETPAERTSIPGMEAKRADIIPAGIIILMKIFELFRIKKMVVSEYALREGIVLDTAEIK